MSEIREPVTHNLKIWPEHYSAVCAGLKRAELRKNDRDYRAGDTLDLCEWDKDDESFTGNYISVTVTHVAEVGEWMPGYVLLSIARAMREREEPVEHEAHIRREVNAGGNTWIQCSKQAFEREKARGALCRVLYESPPAPVVPEEMPKPDTSKMFVADAVAAISRAEGWNACRAAMLAAPRQRRVRRGDEPLND
ncbi:DUF3850 domain-containing protein [Cronobacter sakazakii]|uniref:DUF3850 domain-containing protein n=1 Tax=Cronobacter sakazakii TaxID=28141 RepID=UPI00280B3BBB|nr:DUF3850 domain-containing protein [Cronobacter sakazakii]